MTLEAKFPYFVWKQKAFLKKKHNNNMKNTDLFLFFFMGGKNFQKCKVQGFFVTFGKKKKKKTGIQNQISKYTWKGVSEICLKL